MSSEASKSGSTEIPSLSHIIKGIIPDNSLIKYFCYDCANYKSAEGGNYCSRAGHKVVLKDTETPMDDPVNHPKHYTSDPSGVECITITRHRNFNIGNAMKYLWRAGLKDSDAHVQDLEKAIFYINDEIARLRNESSN